MTGERTVHALVMEAPRALVVRPAPDRALADGREWLCAGRFTGADISAGYALLLAETLGLDERWSDAVRGYWARCQTRPGFERAKAAQKADPSPRP